MEDAGFIVTSYVLTIGAMVVFAVWTLRRAKALAGRLTDEDKPWT